MAYTKRYALGFNDSGPGGGTPVDSQFLNAVEAALLALLGVDATADGQAALWVAANNRYEPALIKNANIDPAAAIARSKLGALNLVDADIAGGANIAASKLAAGIPISKLNGYPGDITKVPRGDGTWGAPSGVPVVYRKDSAKAVTNTVAETDLLNGEITIPAGVLGVSSLIRITLWGDWVQGSGSGQEIPVWALKFGGATLLKTATAPPTSGATTTSSATRYGWRIVCEIKNTGAANAQWASIDGWIGYLGGTGVNGGALFATGEGFVLPVGPGVATKPGMTMFRGGGAGTVDTTLAAALVFTVINPSATSVETKLLGAVVEVF